MALRIKPNIDLKELEKYGLIERDDLGVINYCYYKENKELWISGQKIVCIGADCEAVTYETIPDEILDILYDLIKADLVEKVEDND